MGHESNYDRRMTFLKTPIALHVHLAGSLMISCWIDVMEGVLSSLVRNWLLRYIIIFRSPLAGVRVLLGVQSWLTSRYYLPQCLSIEWQEKVPTASIILAVMC
jgi:hypothetical protein